MDSQQRWQNIRQQLDKSTKNLEAKNRFAINDKIMKKSQEIMTKKSLSLIYDEYGNQMYEKNTDIQNYVICKKTGSTFILVKDESKLIETEHKNDKFNTDFIQYGTLPEINQDYIKHEIHIDENIGFQQNNDYLYLQQEKDKIKDKVINQGIDEIKNYINITGRKELNKIDMGFIGMIK